LLAQGTGESAEAEWDEVEPPVRLPRRQREVLAGLLSGSSVKEIAVQLGISPYTVNDYVKAIYKRYKVSSRGELMAVVHGLRPLRRLQATGPAAPQ
jgi:DNA-binding NarL/FixJ family response regulator